MGNIVQYHRRTKAISLPRHLQIAAARYTAELGTREAMRVFASMLARQDATSTKN